MCEICGAIDLSETANAAELGRRMNPTMLHRGPDDSGIAEFGFRNADLGNNQGSRRRTRRLGRILLRVSAGSGGTDVVVVFARGQRAKSKGQRAAKDRESGKHEGAVYKRE